MAALTSVPNHLINDKNLKDFDKIVYMVIAQYVNNYGYTKISNETLEYKLDKGKRAVQRAIDNLIKCGYLVRKQNVKKNNIYDGDYARVIWLDEFYRKYDHRTKKAKEKTVRNDWRKFVNWLKTDCVGIKFPVSLGGPIVHDYMIKKLDNKPILHVFDRDKQEYVPIDKYDSKEVFDYMFRKKSIILERLLKEDKI